MSNTDLAYAPRMPLHNVWYWDSVWYFAIRGTEIAYASSGIMLSHGSTSGEGGGERGSEGARERARGKEEERVGEGEGEGEREGGRGKGLEGVRRQEEGRNGA
eukprot:416675-Rhodomonas_salina.1